MRKSQSNTRELLARLQPWIALFLMLLLLSVVSPAFRTFDNGRNILRQISVNLCLSIGMTLVILTGGIDLSVGAVLAFASAIAAGLLKSGLVLHSLGIAVQFTVFGAIVAGIVSGMFLGWVNGILITRFSVPPFVATLGMLSAARGLTMLWTGGFPITSLGKTFAIIGSGSVLQIPLAVWATALLALFFAFVTRRTPFGRYIYAIGGNERASVLSGLPVNRVKCAVYTITGALAGLGGLILASRLDSAQPEAGMGYELDSIAAVVVGGCSLSGGRGSILGTVLGCLIIGVLNNGLFLLDVSAFWQQVIKGAVIVIAVAVDRRNAKSER